MSSECLDGGKVPAPTLTGVLIGLALASMMIPRRRADKSPD
jgi:hypothetical protein